MNEDKLAEQCEEYLRTLCIDINERCVGSEGNRQATSFFNRQLTALGWKTEMPEFTAVDWVDGGATLSTEGEHFVVHVSPYSPGCMESATLESATTIAELERLSIKDKILFLHGEIAKEQLMPKNFVFFNPEEHKRITGLLEAGNPKAIVCATSRNGELAGGVYPFPLIEDGDFDIPSVYMTEEEGNRLVPFIGKMVTLRSIADRTPGAGYNVIGTKGRKGSNRIVVTAHIDAKKGTPGAIDNATGVIVLLLLAHMLKDYSGKNEIEIVALNGEDYYSVPGQMNYVMANQDRFDTIALNINIDGAGYREGDSSFSLFNLPGQLHRKVLDILVDYSGIVEGVQWPQGDHSIFIQHGIPAIAVSSKWFIDNIASQEITHTPSDNPGIVDCAKVVEIAEALNELILKL